MSALVNDRDAQLQGTVPRVLDQGADKVLLLNASVSSFHVSSAGIASPSSITVTGLPINLPGIIEFSIVGGTLAGTGNSRTLAFADTTAAIATISAQISFEGVVYHAPDLVINQSFDGTSGIRGTQALFIEGSAWSDIAADAATTGDNQIGDSVTISDGDKFVMRKVWDGDAWVLPGSVVDGGEIVDDTVTTPAVANNAITIPQIATGSTDKQGTGAFQAVLSVTIVAAARGTYLAGSAAKQDYHGDSTWAASITCDSATIFSSGGDTPSDSIALIGGIYLEAGTHTFTLNWKAGTNVYLQSRTLYVMAALK